MTNSESKTGKCIYCGSEASLSASGSDGVFRPICKSCFIEGHNGRSPPDYRDWTLLSAAVVGGIAADISGLSTVTSIGLVMMVFVGWLAMTTASGAYPWSLPPIGGHR